VELPRGPECHRTTLWTRTSIISFLQLTLLISYSRNAATVWHWTTTLSLSYGLAQIRTLWLVQLWIFASQICKDCLSIIELFMLANPSFGPFPVVKALRLLARGVYLNAAPTPHTCKTAVS
jgi:hypothetical protein